MPQQVSEMTTVSGTLAKQVRERRKNLGLTQAQFAGKVGVSPRMIASIELEEQWPSPEVIGKIAAFFEIPEPQLFFDIETVTDEQAANLLSSKFGKEVPLAFTDSAGEYTIKIVNPDLQELVELLLQVPNYHFPLLKKLLKTYAKRN